MKSGLILSRVEEAFHGSIWYTVTPLLVTDDAVRVRVVVSRWNKGDRCGPLGRVFFNMLTLERHRELWHYDTDGNRVTTMVKRRVLVLENMRIDGLRLPRKVQFSDGAEEDDETDVAFRTSC